MDERYEVMRAKDGWHVVKWTYEGVHPDYVDAAGPFPLKSEANLKMVELKLENVSRDLAAAFDISPADARAIIDRATHPS